MAVPTTENHRSGDKKELSDFYGERVYSKTFGYGRLTRVYGEEVSIAYEKGSSRIYRENPFSNGAAAFCDPALTELFRVIYERYTHSDGGKAELFDIWLHRGS